VKGVMFMENIGTNLIVLKMGTTAKNVLIKQNLFGTISSVL